MRNKLPIGGIVAALLVTSVSSVHAQPPIEVDYADDRTGCGSDAAHALCDGFWWGSADATFPRLTATQDGVQLTVSADFDSTFYVDVVDQQATGEWLIGGDWKMLFSGQVSGEANVVLQGSGAIAGGADRFGVSGTQTNTGTVTIGGRSNAINNSETLSGLEVEVTGGTCVEATGEWKYSWASLATSVGWTDSDTITGSFTAIRQEQDDLETTRDLLDRKASDEEIDASALPSFIKTYVKATIAYNTLAVSWAATDTTITDVLANRALDIVNDIELAQAEARNAGSCEREMFEGVIRTLSSTASTAVADLIRLGSLDGSTVSGRSVRRLATAAVRTGVVGAGSARSTLRQEASLAEIEVMIENVLAESTVMRGNVLKSKRGHGADVGSVIRVAIDLGIHPDAHGATLTNLPAYTASADRLIARSATDTFDFSGVTSPNTEAQGDGS